MKKIHGSSINWMNFEESMNDQCFMYRMANVPQTELPQYFYRYKLFLLTAYFLNIGLLNVSNKTIDKIYIFIHLNTCLHYPILRIRFPPK